MADPKTTHDEKGLRLSRRQFKQLASGLAASAASASLLAAGSAAGAEENQVAGWEWSSASFPSDHLAVHNAPSQSGLSGPWLHFSNAYNVTPESGDMLRVENETHGVCARMLTAVENGQAAFLYPTGTAANRAVLELVEPGQQIIADKGVFVTSQRLLANLADRGVTVTFVDATDVANVEAAITPQTALIFVEPLNHPFMRVMDVGGIGSLARQRSIPALADNSIATGLLVRPLDHGFTFVSLTSRKAPTGSSDVRSGAVITADADHPMAKQIAQSADLVGDRPGVMDSYFLIRSMTSLGPRLDAQSRHAAVIAAWLAARDDVDAIYYAAYGTPEEVARARGILVAPGGVLSFRPSGGPDRATDMVARLRLIRVADGYGTTETTIVAPVHIWDRVYPGKAAKTGIDGGLLRLSAGLEEPDQVIADLDQAMAG